MFRKLIIFVPFFLFACAGPNPNIGERTTDIGWTSGDYQTAFDTAKIYAEQGHPWAQLRLGIFYANGWGVQQDNKAALDWYSKAAAQTASGDWANGQMVGATGKAGYFNQNSDAIIATFNLAYMYFEGGTVEKDLEKSLQLVNSVIAKSNGQPVFFCCEFSNARYFYQEQFIALKEKIEQELANK